MATLFDDTFQIDGVETGRYNKVSRLEATSTTTSSSSEHQTKITLDINSELFPISKNESLTVSLSKTLSLDNDEDMEDSSINASWRPSKLAGNSLADQYDYVMHGTVYKFEEVKNDLINVYISFGGLLCCIEGDYRILSGLKQEGIYILIRRG